MKSYIPVIAITAVFLGTALYAPAAAASPWTLDRGEYFLQLGQSYYNASEYRDAGGGIRDDASYSNLTSYAYGEVGLFDDVHLQFYAPFVAAWSEHEAGSFQHHSFGDTLLSVQASPVDLQLPTSIRLETKLPLYAAPDEPGAPIAGDHQIDVSGWLSVGGGLHHWEIPMYFYLDAGYVHRTRANFDAQRPGGDYSDAFSARLEAGYTVAELVDLSIGTSAFLPYSFNEARDEAYVTVGPGVFVPLTERIAVDADAYFTPYSRNAGAGWAISAGISLMNPVD